MIDEPTNRELKLMLDNSISKSDDRHGEVMRVLKKIDDSTDLFEPRISRLEYWRTAVVTALGFVVAALVFMFPYLLHFVQVEITSTVRSTLSVALEKYGIDAGNY